MTYSNWHNCCRYINFFFLKLKMYNLFDSYDDIWISIWTNIEAGVPLTDYKRIGGSAVGGSIGWNLPRLFSTDRFDPAARPSEQILAIISVAIKNYLRSSDKSLTWQTTADYLQILFSPDASSRTGRFFIRFSIWTSDPPISRPMWRQLKYSI